MAKKKGKKRAPPKKSYKKKMKKAGEPSDWLREKVQRSSEAARKPERFSKHYVRKLANAAEAQKYYRTKNAGAYVTKDQLSHFRRRDWVHTAPQHPM